MTTVSAGVRRTLRRGVYRWLDRALSTDDGRALLHRVVAGFAPARELGGAIPPAPYRDLPTAPRDPATPVPVFITARFRSGSTLLWQIFRAVPGATAYYEPHNERRWFDPSTRGARVDTTHVGVDDYWREYDGMEALGAWYQAAWIDRRLYMAADADDADMGAYLDHLIDHAAGRPVLQFNHVDFRLPWLMRRYPRARLIHLYRHPRDQWVSTLGPAAAMPYDVTTDRFEPYDGFYLLRWARDLRHQFPFLDPAREVHPYRLFYCIWRLSQAFAWRHAHLSIAYERLIGDPHTEIRRLLEAAQWPGVEIAPLARLVRGGTPGGWTRFAPAEWFAAHEAACEATLARELGGATFSVPDVAGAA